MSLKIKVCGMREAENIREVTSLNPDYLGFIFYEKSKRFVGDNFEIPSISKKICRVGVFVNHDFDFIKMTVGKHNLNFVQLHGNETPELCDQLKSLGLKVVKAFLVDPDFNFETVQPYKNHVDYFLFDTKGSDYGGTGKTFDWKLLEGYKLSIPFFLSGGINIKNINQLEFVNHPALYTVDLNSGVEEYPGKKDISKLNDVIKELTNLRKYESI